MYSVLLIDDEDILLDVGKRYLEKSGSFMVDVANSASAGIEKIRTTRYDAIIADYQMPRMDGIEFLKHVRSTSGDLPFILYTGKGREEIAIQAINHGANFYLQKGGEPKSLYAELAHKITVAVEHQQSKDRVRDLHQLHTVLLATNKAIATIPKKQDLFSELCRILVDIGGFRMVWIGLADAEKKAIIPTVSFGHVDGYLDTVAISLEDEPRGRGPTGSAYREGRYYYSNDITNDPRLEPWRDACLNRGYRANAAFPFALNTPNAGILNVYAPVTGFFTDGIISLLEELSQDITFALKILDEKEARRLAEKALLESEKKYRNIFNDAILGIYRTTPEGTYLDMNPAFAHIAGYDTPEEMIVAIRDIKNQLYVHPKDRINLGTRLLGGEVVRGFETECYHKDGHRIWIRINAICVRGPEGNPLYFEGSIEDITKQKQVEIELQSAYEQLSAAEEELQSQYNELKMSHDISQRNEANLHRAEKVAGIGHWEIHLGTKKIEYSAGAGAIYGTVGKKLFLEDIQKITLPEFRPALDEALEALIGQQKPYDVDFAICRLSDGSLRYIHSLAQYDPANRIVFGVIHDITDQKTAQHALQESEEKFRSLVEHGLEGILIVDFSGKVLFANNAMARIVGAVDGSSLISRNVMDFIAPESRDKVISDFDEVARGNDAFLTRYSVISLQGKQLWLECIGKAISFEGKTADLISIRDITGRMQTEAALKESEQRHRLLADNATDVIWTMNLDGLVTYVSPSVERLRGFTPEEIVQQPMDRVLTSASAAVARRMLATAIEDVRAGQRFPTFRGDLEQPCKDGSIILTEVTASGIYNKSNEFIGILGVSRDISERRNIENALRLSNQKLNLLSNISRHDIRNQILGLKAYLHMAKEMSGNPERMADYLGKAETTANTIEHQILFTREYQDLGVHAPAWQNAGTCAHNAVAGLDLKGISLALTDLDSIEILSDPLLQKVFFNLIDNALRHGGKTLTGITFSSRESGSELVIICEDNGLGVAAEEKDLIFERGYGKNTGYGLFLIREILAIKGISIRETGIPGTGARFEIHVPPGVWRYAGSPTPSLQ
jgi:PAS domain S-box-containing protein